MRFQRFLLAATSVAAMTMTSAAMASSLSVGDVVTIGDSNNNAFTPSEVPSDPNGLAANVGFRLNNSNSTVNANAGMFVLNYTHDVPSTANSNWTQFLSFCLEPDVYLTPFANPYSVQSVGGAGYNNALLSELWGRYRGTVDTDVEAAAFQVAVWELSFGSTDLNLATGAFQLTSPVGNVGTLATQWLSSLNGSGPLASGLVVLVNNQRMADRQDLITQTQVREPGTLALLGLGLVGLGFSRRRASN